MTDENLKLLGRKLLREAMARTDAGKLAAQIGAMLYDGLAHRCFDCKCALSETYAKRYQENVVQLTAIQSYLEKLAVEEAEKLVWKRAS